MLNMSLNEIRGKIQIYPENWVNKYTTNCYAYALGLDVRESDICKHAYQPGTISGTTNIHELKYFFYDMLIEGIESDLDVLGISYREVLEKEKLELNEWKIALFIDKYHGSLIDFHFLRQKENGIWLHKNGYMGTISKKDYIEDIITVPSEAELFPYIYKKCYALKLKNNIE